MKKVGLLKRVCSWLVLLIAILGIIFFVSRKEEMKNNNPHAQENGTDKGLTNGQGTFVKRTSADNVPQIELEIPKEFQKKIPRTEILARIEREKELLPKRGSEPRQHNPVAVSGNDCGSVAMPSSRDYSNKLFKIVDYRETLEQPAIRKSTYKGIVTCEWLISLDETMGAIVVKELYHEYESGPREHIATAEFAADQVVAQVKAQHSLLDFRDKVEELGLSFAEVLLTDDKGDSLIVITTPSATLDSADNAIEQLRNTNMCSFVEVDSVVRPSKTPNDAYYSDQWWLSKIGAPTAWNTTTGSASVLVGVVDTGIAYFHWDLQNNLWRGPNGEYGINTFGGQNSTANYWVIDDNGHGTHVSGIIGAVGNDGVGVSGVNWTTKIVTANYTYCGGTNMGFATDSVAGFEYCKKQGCKVINFSSGALANDEVINQTSIQTFNSGINSLRSAGVILVCAAGNEANNNDSLANYPSNCPQDNVIAVAATTSTDTLASFSNYGMTSVDIAAPGYNILSTYVMTSDFENYTTGWASLSGTSMAAPTVTGSIALLMSKYPSESYTQIINRILNSADKISALNSKIPDGRRLNVANSMNYLTIPGNVKATQGTLADKVTISWDATTGASYYRVFYATSNDSSKATALSSWQTAMTYDHTSAVKGTTYYYWVKAATSSAGANASGYSASAAGWIDGGSDYIDEYEPNDLMKDAIVISPSTTKKTHGQHGLVYDESASSYKEDKIDIFKINMTSGTTYVFESKTVGNSSEAKDPYGIIYDLNGNFLFGDDDSSENDGGYDFKVVYTARYSGVHYLAVRAYNTSEMKYNLTYYVGNVNERKYNQVLTYDDIPAEGDNLSIKLNSGDDETRWIFEMNDRPSWLSMTLTIGDSTEAVTGTTKTITFAGEATLAITVNANTTTTPREWKNFNVVLEMGYAQIQILQAGASTLAAPTNVKATDDRTDNITVTWNSVSGAKGYRVARAANVNGTKTTFAWQTTTTYTDTTATAGATYYYWVQAATNADGSGTVSDYSAYDTGTRGTPAVTKYSLNVTNGTGSGEYVQGQKITIKADTAPLGKVFSQWIGNGVAYLDNVANSTATVTMPAQNIRLQAEYTAATNNNDPWGEEPFSDPTSRLQLVYVNVIMDGVPAEEGDWIAAYCGTQMRGKMKLPAGGKGWLKFTTSVQGEKITFKTYDLGTRKILDTAESIPS
ncbi:MAG: S8 family serine peptidase, partial [Victivallales bacterium]|nr:S8 family serine peptidase [Victivallales bacterium]